MQPTDVSALYENLHVFLRLIAQRKFGVPTDEAEELVHDCFVSLIRNTANVAAPREYLIGAVCNAARAYWRRERRTPALPQTSSTSGASPEQLLALRQLLSRVPSRYRQLLELHHGAGYTATELAMALGTTTRYAEKLLHKAVLHARAAANPVVNF